jgi:hypothetical protein
MPVHVMPRSKLQHLQGLAYLIARDICYHFSWSTVRNEIKQLWQSKMTIWYCRVNILPIFHVCNSLNNQKLWLIFIVAYLKKVKTIISSALSIIMYKTCLYDSRTLHHHLWFFFSQNIYSSARVINYLTLPL